MKRYELRAKFENIYIYIDREPVSINCRLADTNDIDSITQCEQITDDFAIKFAEWYIDNYHLNKTTTELLQIFKTNHYE